MTGPERREAIIEALCLRRHEVIDNLAFEFGVTRRTIERDVLILTLSYPIYATKGYGGGVHVMDGYHLARASKMNEEQLALLDKLSRTLTGKEKETMESIIKYGGGRLQDERT